jgi:hypothetical protein
MGSATASAPARAGRVSKPRKLTLSAAVDQWSETTLAIEGLSALRKEAAEVLLAHAERTGRRTYKDRIAVVQTGGSLVLDQGKVTEYLQARGQVLTDFQKRSKLGLALKLLS